MKLIEFIKKTILEEVQQAPMEKGGMAEYKGSRFLLVDATPSGWTVSLLQGTPGSAQTEAQYNASTDLYFFPFGTKFYTNAQIFNPTSRGKNKADEILGKTKAAQQSSKIKGISIPQEYEQDVETLVKGYIDKQYDKYSALHILINRMTPLDIVNFMRLADIKDDPKFKQAVINAKDPKVARLYLTKILRARDGELEEIIKQNGSEWEAYKQTIS